MATTEWIKVVKKSRKGKGGLKRHPDSFVVFNKRFDGSRQPTKPASVPSAQKQSKKISGLASSEAKTSRSRGAGLVTSTTASEMPKEIFQRAFTKALRARASYLGRRLVAAELRALSLSLRKQYNPPPPRSKKGKLSKLPRAGLGYMPRPQAPRVPIKQQKSADVKKQDTYASAVKKVFVRGKPEGVSEALKVSKGADLLRKGVEKASAVEVTSTAPVPTRESVMASAAAGRNLLEAQAASAAARKLFQSRFRLFTALQRSGIDAVEKALLLAEYQEAYPDDLKRFVKVAKSDKQRVFCKIDFSAFMPKEGNIEFIDEDQLYAWKCEQHKAKSVDIDNFFKSYAQ